MLFLSESIIKAKDKILAGLEKGKLDPITASRQILELDPDDHEALCIMADVHDRAGDRAAAEELLWRAAQAQPASFAAYLKLSVLFSGQEPLSKGLTELACRKVLRNEEALAATEDSPSPFASIDLPEFNALGTAGRLKQMAEWFRDQREHEPPAVSALLKPHRLIDQLLESDTLAPELVDAFVQEKPAIVTLLIGVLRGWIADQIPESEIAVVENALALLGEIGEPSAIPFLLETSALEDRVLAAISDWALDRIVAQQPDQSAGVMAEVAPGFGAAERVAIAESLLRHPKLDPSGALFEKLFEGWEKIDKNGREACFQILMTTAILQRGLAGIDFARGLMRRHGNLLSKTSRGNLTEMIEEIRSVPLTPFVPPEPSPWTIYQICSGEVDWEKEIEDDEDEDEEEESGTPEPVRRKFTPGRNDPCWCGSGKKYKKCHLLEDEQGQHQSTPDDTPPNSESEFDHVRRRVGELLHKELPESETRAAISEFFGSSKIEEGMGEAFLVDWMVHDRVSETLGRTVMEHYLHRHRMQLTDREREFLESSADSYVDLLEVQKAEKGHGVEVKSLTSGDTFFVHDVSISKVALPWDGLFGRVIHGERGIEFTGTCSQIRRHQLADLRSWMVEDKSRTDLSWPVYLKRNWPRIRARSLEIGDEMLGSLRLRNNDGDEFMISKAAYGIVNRGALIASLRSSAELDESEEGATFVWLDGPAAKSGQTVLGTIRIASEVLTIECNSKKRLERGKKLLKALAGPALKFEKETFESTQDLLRQIKDDPPVRKSSGIPPEVERELMGEVMEKHYAQWPDTKLPALGGKTPRQAVKTAEGRNKVAELLKLFENDEAHKAASRESAYDVSRLRAELGITV